MDKGEKGCPGPTRGKVEKEITRMSFADILEFSDPVELRAWPHKGHTNTLVICRTWYLPHSQVHTD